MPAMPNAGRRKVRCPKCTALFSEPAKAIFECPICSCHLAANGVVASTADLFNQAKEREFGQTKAAFRSDDDDRSKVQSQDGDRSDTQRDTQTEVSEETRGALRTQIHNEEQQTVSQNEGVSDNGGTVDGTIEDLYGNRENAAKDKSLVASSLALVNNNEMLEGADSIEKVSAANKRLDLEMFRTTRCEFSFKYSLEGAQPVDSDSNQKKLPPSKFSLSVSNSEASNEPLHTPLRVKISNRREESSDQSEHGRYSFGSDTDSHDGSESDFDFPAPWADGLPDKVLPDLSGQNEIVQYHSKQVVSATPHRLELWDAYDATANEEHALQESTKHSEGSEAELPLQAGDTVNALSPLGREDELRDDVETSRSYHASQGNDLANIISSVVTLNHDQNLVKSPGATILSKEQDPQFASRLHNIFSVDEAQSASHKGPARHDIQASDAEGAPESEHMLLGGMGKMGDDNHSSILQGPLADLGKVVHTNAEPLASEKNTYDHHLLQDAEMDLDLYSHHKVDEWQHEQAEDSPSSAHYYTPMRRNQSYHSDLPQMDSHSCVLSDYAVSSAPLANSQPYVNHHVSDHLSFGASSSNQILSYQVPIQPLVLPATFQDHLVAAPFAYHTVPNACTLCSHHQHPYMQTHFGPHCAVCLSHSGSVAWNSGHADQWSCHQAHHGPAPAFASSLVACTEGPTSLSQRYDIASADLRLQAYISDKLSPYPPLPTEGAAPYVSCKGCSTVLQVPFDLPSANGFVQKLRCSACGRVNKFSAKGYLKQQQVVSSLPSLLEMKSMGGAANILPLVQYNSCSIISSHAQHVLPMSSWQHEERASKTTCQVDGNVYASRPSPLSLQGGDYLRNKQRDCVVDSSVNMGPHHLEKASSMGIMVPEHKVLGSTDNARFERRRQDAVSSLHVAVDEKEEGLDFGAPRISDGDSLDQSDSRMRSPENIQAQSTCARVHEDVALSDTQTQGQLSKLDQSEEPNLENQGKKPGSPLLVLLNQESTRFSLSLNPRAPSEELKSASWSPASDLPPIDKVTQNRIRRERGSSQSRKGPKYIAGLLRRSLKDFSKGGQ